jgi:hypothetical protein
MARMSMDERSPWTRLAHGKNGPAVAMAVMVAVVVNKPFWKLQRPSQPGLVGKGGLLPEADVYDTLFHTFFPRRNRLCIMSHTCAHPFLARITDASDENPPAAGDGTSVAAR